MGFYLLANFFSALSNTLAKYLTHNGFFPSGTRVLDIFLHANLINLLLFFAIYFFKKRRNEIHFSIKETFFRKDEFKQVLLFAIPILAASYKLFMMDFMKISDIEISAMIKPFCVFITAVRFKIHGVNVEHDLVKKHRVSFQSSAGNLSGFFHCEKNIHI